MLNMKPNRTSRIPAAFTLIELLTVLAIIGILAGLLFPAIKSALQRAEIAQAQNDIKTIETAAKMFYVDYGKWPNGNAGSLDFSYGAFTGGNGAYGPQHPGTAGHSGYCENHWLMETLQAIPETTTEVGPDDPSGPPYCGNGSTINNPSNLVNTRNTPYLTIPTKSRKLSSDGTGGYDFVDPWGNPYQITLDTTYDNVCSNLAYSAQAYTPLGTGVVGCVSNYNVVVWSFGPLGPYSPHNAKDWITSW